MSVIAVADTHAILWAVTGQLRLLGRKARRFFEDVDAGKASLYVPVIALVEIEEAVHAGRVEFRAGFEVWLDRLLASGRYHAVDLTVAIVRRAHRMHAIPERGDRLIAATAVELDCPLVTRDPEIARASGVDLLW